MGRPKTYRVELSTEERDRLGRLTRKGRAAARTLRRAQILLLSADGLLDAQIAATLHVGLSTVHRTRQRYCAGGLASALHERPRPGGAPKLDAKQEAFLIALACSAPPDERTTWTMQLLADRLVTLEIVDAISDETVRRTLKKTCSSPGSASSGAFPT
jgi:transposase